MNNSKNQQSNDPKSSSIRKKVFGANSLQVTGDNCSLLIGSIIEKGISENSQINPIPPPKPSVFPFPVARHRSHGPHWGRLRSESNANSVGDNDEEDDDSMAFDKISAFANPVDRKKKKGLDLSRWRNVIAKDYDLHSDKMKVDRQKFNKIGMDKRDIDVVDSVDNMEMDVDQGLSSIMPAGKVGEAVFDDKHGQFPTSEVDMEICNLHEKILDEESIRSISSSSAAETHLTNTEKTYPEFREMLGEREQKASTISSSDSSFAKFGKEQGSMFLKGEIDAENRARLKSMSAEEITEAQAEIKNKMSPALINLLKKRGQLKLKQKDPLRPDEAISNEHRNTINKDQSANKSNALHNVGSDNFDMMTVNTATGTKNGPDSDMRPRNSSMWNSWSERVESVRRLRFSLEGGVIPNESESGNIAVDDKRSAVNVTERDFLRTEGDPAAVGYTIKEAVQLTRSVIPGQRTLALHLLAFVLDKAMHNIRQNQVGHTVINSKLFDKLIDWEAIWAYALGPDPELALSLRLCLDDNHNSVVLACARVIECALSCDLNESFFDISAKTALHVNDIFTAPVFRRKPEIDGGFLHGGFWKYNAKPSNILATSGGVNEDEIEGEHTIQDDIVVATQDFAAGLVRMEILTRIRYLLEDNSNVALEESIISILIAIARHSPTCANAVMKCQGLVHTVVQKFTMEETGETNPSRIKSITLLRVLAQSDKKNCMEFISNGFFPAVTRHLFRYTSSHDEWMKSGKENFRILSALMIEQLRFWRVCINYGFCISYFSDVFPALCLWLTPPSFKKLQENNVLTEFISISREGYLVLEAMARKLPCLYPQKEQSTQFSDCAADEPETWSWSFVSPMVDIALKWIALKNEPCVSKLFERKQSGSIFHDSSECSLLWVFSAVIHLLLALLERVNPGETMASKVRGKQVPWLPEFVPKIGLEIIKQWFSSINGADEPDNFDVHDSFLQVLCCLRQKSDNELSLASVCCLHGLLRVITAIDNLISMAKSGISNPPTLVNNFSREEKILKHGILNSSLVDSRCLLNVFMKLMESEWQLVPSVEIFGRGGPSPGAGLGWGASGGGFWSVSVLLAQTDARLLIYMLEIFQIVSTSEYPTDEEITSGMCSVNSVLEACLTVGPRDRIVMEKALNILLHVPVLKYLGICIQHFLKFNQRLKPFNWEYREEDYLLFCEILASHYKNRWLSVKKKSKAMDEKNTSRNKTVKSGVSLETIHEDFEISSVTNEEHSCDSLTQEWARQRLPLPMHWFLSPISAVSNNKSASGQSATNKPILVWDPRDIEVAKGGLFFLLAMEAMSTFLPTDVHSPISSAPLVWKFHSLSIMLLVGMDVLDDNKSRDVYEALQDVYGQLLDRARSTRSSVGMSDEGVDLLPNLKFQSEIHESYSTFLEILVEQFSAVSYGDSIFGRQISLFLHRCCEAPVRLHAWNVLSNARVLEILPPLEKCIAEAEGYLEPMEDNEDILEAYVKSWISGALDRSVSRGSMAFSLVLHHLSSFIFIVDGHDKTSLRNKLVKSLLRDLSHKQKHKAMMMELVRYIKPQIAHVPDAEVLPSKSSIIEKRFELLAEVCERDSALLTEVENLRSFFVNKPNSVK